MKSNGQENKQNQKRYRGMNLCVKTQVLIVLELEAHRSRDVIHKWFLPPEELQEQ